MMYVIYALIDPRDNTVHYVGMTQDVYGRFLQHIRCEESNTQKNIWIGELRAANKLVIMKPLEEVEGSEKAAGREAYWIRHFEMLGQPLTNIKRASMWNVPVPPEPTKIPRSAITEAVSDQIRGVIRRAYALLILTGKKSHKDIAHVVGLDDSRFHIYKEVCAEEGIPVVEKEEEA